MGKGFLYVVLRPTDGARKVGQSAAPGTRLQGINSEQKCRCALEYWVECPPDVVDAAERHAHAVLWNSRVEKEWFAVSLDAARDAVDDAVHIATEGGPTLKPPRPPLSNPNPERLAMRVDLEWLQKVDDLRRLEDDLPTRSEYIRRVIDRAFEQRFGQEAA